MYITHEFSNTSSYKEAIKHNYCMISNLKFKFGFECFDKMIYSEVQGLFT